SPLALVVGQGPTARSIKLPLRPFCLAGATARAGLLTSALRDRFGATFRLDFYGTDDLQRILRRSAAILGAALDDDGAAEIARRARGTPRIANRLLRRVRDFAEVRADGKIDRIVARDGLRLLDVDDAGFDKLDRALLLVRRALPGRGRRLQSLEAGSAPCRNWVASWSGSAAWRWCSGRRSCSPAAFRGSAGCRATSSCGGDR